MSSVVISCGNVIRNTCSRDTGAVMGCEGMGGTCEGVRVCIGTIVTYCQFQPGENSASPHTGAGISCCGVCVL